MSDFINETNTEHLSQKEIDEHYMRMAIELAKKGAGRTNPNPMVGAVIVKDGRIIGQGYHRKYGELHAERNAIASLTESAENATIYVTLEPCCHYGKTPPCTEALIENKIARVVVGSFDPNPKVSGKGIKQLRDAGIKVDEDVLRDECDAINYVFLHYIQSGTPYVVMKYAMTADGKIATVTGKSRWITGEAARKRTHEDRNRYAAIMVGVGTVLADNPMLTCRIDGGRNPIRIICDSNLRTPLNSAIVRSAKDVPTIIATCISGKNVINEYTEAGCEVITIPADQNGSVDLKLLMKELGSRKIDSIILEGGATLNAAALSAGIVQRLQVYVAPKIFGGQAAKSPIGGAGVDSPDDAYNFKAPTVTVLGNDILLESEVIKCSQE